MLYFRIVYAVSLCGSNPSACHRSSRCARDDKGAEFPSCEGRVQVRGGFFCSRLPYMSYRKTHDVRSEARVYLCQAKAC